MRSFISIILILGSINVFSDVPGFLNSISSGEYKTPVPLSSDSLLIMTYAQILMDSIVFSDDTDALKVFITQKFPGRDAVLKKSSSNMSIAMLDMLYKKGIETDNTEYNFSRQPDDIDIMKRYINERRASSDSIVIANADRLPGFALAYAAETLNRQLLMQLSSQGDYAYQCTLLLNLMDSKPVSYEVYDKGRNIFEYVKDKDFLIKSAGQLIDMGLTDRMEYYAGRFLENQGNYIEAVDRYIKTDDPEAVIRNIALAGEKYGSSVSDSILSSIDSRKPEILYHKAKMLIKKGSSEGEQMIRDIMEMEPIDYYSAISMKLLKEFKADSKQEIKISSEYDSLFNNMKGYEDYFWKYISLKVSTGNMTALYAAEMAVKFNTWHKAMEYGYKAYYADKKADVITYLFPTPYMEYFSKSAKQYNVDIALLYAMAREESWFNPKAISPVGAKGIMQLMDFVYESYYKDRGYFNPEKNINAGTAHIKEYLGQFPDNTTFGIMSYNAGVGAVRKWERKHVDWELFLECVPYRETRVFVKRVLRSYIFYKYVLKIGN